MYSVRCARRISLWCLFALVFGRVSSRPDGAPSSACNDMTPQHTDAPLETDCPFVTKPAKDEIWSNGTLEITLEPKDAAKFKGFMVMAFDSESSESTPIGTFSIPKDGKAIDCRKDGSKSAVTHNGRTPKSSVVATWTPPKDFEGSVVFRASFVEAWDKYWVKQLSSTVKVKRFVSPNAVPSDDEVTTKKPNTTTAAPAITTESSSTWTTPVPPEVPDSASPISFMAFYSVIIIGITIAFMA